MGRQFHHTERDHMSTTSDPLRTAAATFIKEMAEVTRQLRPSLEEAVARIATGALRAVESIDECLAESAPAQKLNGAALRAWRIEKGLTQTNLARLIQTGTGTIKQLELGTRGASPHRIAQLAEALGCSIEALTCCEAQS